MFHTPVSYTHLVCIDRMEFNPDGTIKQVIPTP